MDAGRLLAILEMDDKSFLATVDGAKKSVGGFDSTMSKAQAGLSKTSRAMNGLSLVAGESTGHFGRLGQAVTSFISAFAVNPIYAVLAAITMVVGYLVTNYEKAMTTALEKTKALAKAEGELGDAIRKRLGLSQAPMDIAKKEAESAVVEGRGGNLSDIKNLADKRRSEAAAAKAKMEQDERGSVFHTARPELRSAYTTAVEVSRVTDEIYNKAVAARQEKSRKAYERTVAAEMEQDDKAGEAKKKIDDDLAADAKKNQEDAAKFAEKYAYVESKGMAAISDAGSGKGVSLRDWSVNSVTSQGGQLGTVGVNPGLRAADRQIQINANILTEVKKMREELNELVNG